MAKLDAAAGNVEASLGWLRRLAAVGATANLGAEEAFSDLVGEAGFDELAARLVENGRPQAPAEVVATLDDAELWPEGVAFDSETGDLFVGSMSKNKIVTIRSDGVVEDFGTSAEDDLWPVLGMTVDVMRRHLWAAMGEGSDELVTEGERRRNGVVRYDLETGRQLARYELADDGVNRLLNDVVVATDGTAYVTESNHGSVYRITPEDDALRHFRFFPDLNYLNGLALSADDRILYLAAVEGVFALLLDEERLLPLAQSDEITSVGGDGLCRVGSSLIAVQNQPLLGFRVMRFHLDPTGLRITRGEVLAAGLPSGLIPYTCAVGSAEVFINGTGPLDMMDRNEVPAPPAVVRVPLGG